MKKAEFMEFIKGASKESKVQYMIDNNDGSITVLETSEFIRTYADVPATIANFVKASDLNLDCDYIRLNIYYGEAQEADAQEDLFTDDEIETYFSELADDLTDSTGESDDELDGILIELEA